MIRTSIKLLLLLSFFYSFCVSAKSNFTEGNFQELNIDKVEVNCHQHYKCKSMQKKWEMLRGKYSNLDELKENIRLMIYESGIMDFHYSISKDEDLENGEVRYRLIIDFLMRPVLDEISLKTEQKIDLEYLKSLLSLKEKSFFYEDKIPDSIQIIKRYLEESGFLDPEIEYRVNKVDDENQKLIFDIKIGTKTEISSFIVDTKNPKLKRIIESDVNYLLGKPRDLILIQERISQLKEQLFQLGYYFAHLDTQFESFKTDDVLKFKVKIILTEGEHYSSLFSGNKSFSVQDLRSTIVDGMKKGQKTFNINFLKNELKDKYSKIGLMNTIIDIEQRPSDSGKNIFIFKITEGRRIKIKEVVFIGNSFKSQSVLYEIFKERPSPLISNGFYDEAYVESFADKLRNEYVKDGYIFVEVDGPFLKFNKKQTKVSIQYRVKEGGQTDLREIQLQNAPEYLKEGVYSLMSNKVGHPLNVLEINDDMKNANTYLKEQGYYFSKIKNESTGSNSVLSYDDHYKSAKLMIDIETGPYVYLSNIIITGNTKTKENIILREVNLYKNNVITPEDMKRIKASLSSLGLFLDVNLYLVPDPLKVGMVNLVIALKEKDAGLVEISPGFRNDLGIITSLGFGYNNLMGMNRSIYFKIQANRRLNSDNLNGKKFEDRQKKIEYLSNLSFTEPYLFHFPIIFQQSATLSKKSYYHNDAKELRSRSSFSKTLVKWLSAGIRYDFELTDIYNSKVKKKDRYERIGSLTPLIAFDFRDNAINPQEGLLVDCAYEYAEPNLYSKKDIKYEKFTNTNNFYLKMWDLGVLAFSASWGVERNKASGYSMPNTKVFRLNGIDMMRGFRDDEINRIDELPDRPDIASLNIEDRAYFDNIKIEPRFFIGDTFMFGPFLDAGSLFVNHFKPLSLRTSVGISFKIITPVGPIDFGYGLKLKRKLIKDGTGEHWETPGAFTLSIGSF